MSDNKGDGLTRRMINNKNNLTIIKNERIFDNELEATEIFLEIIQQEYISKEFIEKLEFNLVN